MTDGRQLAALIVEARTLDGTDVAQVLRAFELLEVFEAHVDAQSDERWRRTAAAEIVRTLA